jgi:DNA-binding CsgD family transcriptional regulator
MVFARNAALVVMQVGAHPRFVDQVGAPPRALLESHPSWLAAALHGPVRLGDVQITPLRQRRWLLGFAFHDVREGGFPGALTSRLASRPRAHHDLQLFVDGQFELMGANVALADVPDALLRVARQEAGRPFSWQGHWVEPRPLFCTAGRGWSLTLQPCHRVVAPAFGALTPRQVETCEWVASGLTIAEASVQMGCRPDTVRSHLKAAYRVLDVRSRVELVELSEDWARWTTLRLPAA